MHASVSYIDRVIGPRFVLSHILYCQLCFLVMIPILCVVFYSCYRLLPITVKVHSRSTCTMPNWLSELSAAQRASRDAYHAWPLSKKENL